MCLLVNEVIGQEGTTKERKHLFSCFFGLSERELSTVSREKGERGSLFFSAILGVEFSQHVLGSPLPFFALLSFAFEFSSKPCHSVFNPTCVSL